MAAKKYLDFAGFQKLWSKATTVFVAKEEGKGLFSGKYEDLTGVPTKVSQFENDREYTTKTEVSETYATKTENEKSLTDAKAYTDEAVGAIVGFDFQIVEVLPDVSAGKKGVIYLVPVKDDDNVEADSNIYTEYILITKDDVSSFEMIGTTKMDLTGYLQEVDIVAITDEEIDNICVSPNAPVTTTYTFATTGWTLTPSTAELANGGSTTISALNDGDSTTTVDFTLTVTDGAAVATDVTEGYAVAAEVADTTITITITEKTTFTFSATGYTLDPATASLAAGEAVDVVATDESDSVTTVAITLTAEDDGTVSATTTDSAYTVSASTVDGAVTITIATA